MDPADIPTTAFLVAYLSYKVTNERVKLNPEKVQAIKNFAIPNTQNNIK